MILDVRFKEATVVMLEEMLHVIEDVHPNTFDSILDWTMDNKKSFAFFEDDPGGGWHFVSVNSTDWAGRE